MIDVTEKHDEIQNCAEKKIVYLNMASHIHSALQLTN